VKKVNAIIQINMSITPSSPPTKASTIRISDVSANDRLVLSNRLNAVSHADNMLIKANSVSVISRSIIASPQ